MSHSLLPEDNAAEPSVAWELQKNDAPKPTAAIQGNFLRQALLRVPYVGPGCFAKCIETFSEVCRLLWSLHESGLVHRNLNPEHILISEDLVTLIGFLPPPEESSTMSVDAAFIGTPGYAPPEQARGEQIFEPKSDIFALGAVLYEAISNQVPFTGAGLALKLATITKDPEPLQKLVPACPLVLSELCDSMLSKDPSLRPSAKETQETLLQIAREHAELQLPFFSGKNAPLPAPTPTKTETAKPTTEDQLNRILPLRPLQIVLEAYNTRPTHTSQPNIPKDRYFLEYEVGHGGIGKVSRAHDQRLQRLVAVKELLKDNFEARERFLREALLTARLQHPAIIPIYDVGVRADGEVFYSMKLVSGKPLGELIEERKTFYERLALLPHVLIIAEAIAYAHSQKVIHRDLKPDNILVGEFGETFVIDWGSAKDLTQAEATEPKPQSVIEALAAKENSKTPELTIEGSIIGTPAYMPPEQAQGKAATEASDVYALGAILYHLLAGEAPIRDKKKSMIVQAQEGLFVPLGKVQPKTPEDLLAIVQKAMSKEPKDRYPSALSFAEDLRKFQSGQLVEAHKYSVLQRFFKYMKKRKQTFAVGAAAFLLMTTGGVVSVHRIIQEKQAAQQNLNNLKLRQARSELDQNPAKALSWIKTLPRDFIDLPIARMIASDAVHRGIPVVLEGHQGQILDMTYSNTGAWIGSAGLNGTIHLWNAKTHEEKVLGPLRGEVKSIEFSYDDSLLASSYSDGVVRVWNVKTGTFTSLNGHKGGVIYCTFSPDATLLASSGEDGIVYLWDLKTQTHQTIFQSAEPVKRVLFSPDGKLLAAAVWVDEKSSTVNLYSLIDKNPQKLNTTNILQINNIQFSRTGKFLAASGLEGNLFLWSQATGITQLIGHKGIVSAISFSPDEMSLVSGGQDKTIRTWSTQTGTEISVYKGHVGGIRALCFSHSGKFLASASGDKTVQIWDIQNDQHRTLRRHEDIVSKISFSTDDKTLASGSYDSLLLLWEVEPSDRKLLFQQKDPVFAIAISDDGSLIASQRENKLILWTKEGSTKNFKNQEITTLEPQLISLVFSPDKNLLIAGDIKGLIYLFDLQKKSCQILSGHTNAIQKLLFLDQTTFASASTDHSIRIWNIDGTQLNQFDGHTDLVTSIVKTSNHQLLSVSTDKSLKIWDLQNNAFLKSVPLGNFGYDISLSEDEEFVAVGTPSSAIQLWKLSELLNQENPKPTFLEGHNDVTTKIVFVGGGHLLASGSADTTIKVWNIDNKESSTLTGNIDVITGLAVAREAKTIVSSSNDGSVRVWWEEVPESTADFLQWLDKTPSPEISDTNLLK
jgi:WD40 repeat protein/serine/threonine protein kinase